MGNGPFWAVVALGDCITQDCLDYIFFGKILEQSGMKVPENLGPVSLHYKWVSCDGSAPCEDPELRGWTRDDLFPDMRVIIRRPCIWNTYKFPNTDNDCFALYILPWGEPEVPHSPGEPAESCFISAQDLRNQLEISPEQQSALDEYVSRITGNTITEFELKAVAYFSSNEHIC